MPEAFEHIVRERAYFIWIDSGRQDGLAHEHWLRAEKSFFESLQVAATTSVVEAPKKKRVTKAPAEAAADGVAADKTPVVKVSAAKKPAAKMSAAKLPAAKLPAAEKLARKVSAKTLHAAQGSVTTH